MHFRWTYFVGAFALSLSWTASYAADNWVFVSDSVDPIASWNIYVNENTLSTTKIKGAPDQTLVVWDELDQQKDSNRGIYLRKAANCDHSGLVYREVPEYDHSYAPPYAFPQGTSGYAVWEHVCGWYNKRSIWNRLFGR